MSKGRIYDATWTGAVATKGRVYNATWTGTAAAVPHGRVYNATWTGAAGVVLLPFTAMTGVEPLTTVTLTATLSPLSAAATGYTWRYVSGTTVTVSGTGASVTIIAPGAKDGATSRIGVTATNGSVTSAEVTVDITTLPHSRFRATSTGWVPYRVSILA